MISPTINDRPLRYVNVLCFSRDPPPNAVCPFEEDIGAPIGAYPFPDVEERGYRFEEKSNTEETENDRSCLGRAAGLRSSRGSSASKESFLEDATPDLEEEEEVRGPGELDARLASSKESRACG